MSMIRLGASSCARKTISQSTEQWRIFLRLGFNLCVHLSHGKYLKVHKKLLLHVALCYIIASNYLGLRNGLKLQKIKLYVHFLW